MDLTFSRNKNQFTITCESRDAQGFRDAGLSAQGFDVPNPSLPPIDCHKIHTAKEACERGRARCRWMWKYDKCDVVGAITNATWRTNSDFCLLPMLGLLHFHLDHPQHVELMLRRWRKGKTFGVMENKLLAHSLLRKLELPTPPMFYGAFSRKAMGDWPKFSSAELARVLNNSTMGSPLWVLKTISGIGNSMSVFVGGSSTHQDRARVLQNAISIVEQPPDEWQQHYEHRGVMLQHRVKAMFEAKIVVVFGHSVGGTLEVMHQRTDSSGEQTKAADKFSIAFYYDDEGHAECCEAAETAVCPCRCQRQPATHGWATDSHAPQCR